MSIRFFVDICIFSYLGLHRCLHNPQGIVAEQ